MAQMKWLDSGSATTILSTELNSLATNGRAISAADSNTDLDLYCDLEFVVKYTSSIPTAGTKVAEVYILPSVDGTNYPEGSASVDPQKALLVATFETRSPSLTVLERLVAPGITLPARTFKVFLKNTSGKTYGSTLNTLKMRKYKLQTV